MQPRDDMQTAIPGRTAVRPLPMVAVLAGLLVSQAAAAGGGAAAAAAIFRRSYEGAEAQDIARRSLPRERRPGTADVDRARAVGPPAGTAPRPLVLSDLDPARVERTARYRALIEHHSRLHHVDADLVEAVVYIESGGDERAVSRAGAQGLMQLMPATARQLGVTDPFNPEQSIRSGVRHLRDLLDRYGAPELALWAYNAGSGAVRRGRLPPETADYVPRVLAVRQALRAGRHGPR